MFADANTQNPQQATEKYYGKYPGVVVNNSPPDEGTHRGELLVKVPGILEESPDGSGQRSIEVHALPSFLPGFFFIPEVDDRVWVEFVAGDINFPIWTGVWYPQDAAPQTAEEKAPTEFQKVIRTASGHVIQIDDTEGEEQVVISHEGGAKIEIDKDGSILILNGTKKTFIFLNAKEGETTVFDEHSNIMTLTKEGIVLATKGNNLIELKKDEKIKVVSGLAIEISAKSVVLNASSISLGGGLSKFSVPISEQLATLFNSHVHGHPMGTTLPPILPMVPILISSKAVNIG